MLIYKKTILILGIIIYKQICNTLNNIKIKYITQSNSIKKCNPYIYIINKYIMYNI